MLRFSAGIAKPSTIVLAFAVALAFTTACGDSSDDTDENAVESSSGLTVEEPSPPRLLEQLGYDCAGTTATVAFKWHRTRPLGSTQWLDVSIFNNGFEPGTFLSAGPLDGTAESYSWPRVLPWMSHYYRINTLTASGWVSTSTGTFTIEDCAPRSSPTPPLGPNLCGAVPNPYGYNFCGFHRSLIYSPPADLCLYFHCIGNFWNGRGYVIQCRDGTFSKSGGILPGSCSSHGGNSRPLRSP